MDTDEFKNCYKLVEVINKSSLNNTELGEYVKQYALEVHNGDSKIVNKDGYLFYTYGDVNYLVNYIGTDTELTLPANYNGENYEIYKYLFYNNDKITKVIIPDNVTSIGTYAFYNCDSLTSITIGNGVTSIGTEAFRHCNSLTSITIGNGVTSIGNYVFSGCSSLTSITIPDNVTSIGNDAFRNCSSLTSVTIGNGVTSIGSQAFNGCNSLTSVTIPDSVTSIGEYAFNNCSNLTSVTIGKGLTDISEGAFDYCDNLVSINVDEDNLVYKSIDGNLYSKDGTILILYAIGKTNESFMIPNSVTDINDSVFALCYDLKYIFISKEKDSISGAPWGSNATIIWNFDGIEREYVFETNGGTSIDSITTTYLETLPTTTKDGYHFMGWYTDAEFTGKPVTAPYWGTQTTLYAKWITEEEWNSIRDGSSFDKAILATVNGEYTVTINEPGQYYYFEFTPDETAYYLIQATGNNDTYGYLYDSGHNEISSNDDYDDYNFGIEQQLTAGQTYYVATRFYSSGTTGDFIVRFKRS